MKVAHPGLDLDRLESFLAAEVEGADEGDLGVRLLAGGRSNVSYALTQGSRRLVLRRPPLGNILPSAHDMGREFRVLSGLSRVGFPAPRPVLLHEESDVIGAPFMLMEFVDGAVIPTRECAAMLDAQQADELSRSLITTLAGLHRVDVGAAGLATLGRPEGYLQRQVVRWAGQWDRTRTRELPEMTELADWLGDRVPRIGQGLPWSLVHGDFRIDNVILSEEQSARAVLDWEMATLGDPVSDLAIALVYWSEAGDTLRTRIPVAEQVTAGPGFWTRSRIVDEYARLSGFSLEHLDECLVLACFKLAVIMESIHKRTLDGRQLGEGAADSMESAAPSLAALGMSVASGGGVAALGR